MKISILSILCEKEYKFRDCVEMMKPQKDGGEVLATYSDVLHLDITHENPFITINDKQVVEKYFRPIIDRLIIAKISAEVNNLSKKYDFNFTGALSLEVIDWVHSIILKVDNNKIYKYVAMDNTSLENFKQFILNEFDNTNRSTNKFRPRL